MQRLRWGLLLVLLSGAAALSHELLWTRRLVDLLGGSHDSIARVFGCFFFGLSLGAALSTRFTSRTRSCWLIAGCLEIGIAVCAIPAVTLPFWSQWIWPSLGPDLLLGWSGGVLKLLLSVLVVVPPAVLMGMSLPVITAATLGRDVTLSRHGIWLYAANTLGGVLGLAVTAGLGLTLLGVTGTMSWAVALNLIVGLLCFRAGRQGSDHKERLSASKPRGSTPITTDASPSASQAATGGTVPSGMALCLIVAFVSGWGILAAEILVLHLTFNVAPDCLYTTTAVLAAIILTLAMGAAIVPWFGSTHRLARHLLPAAFALGGLLTAAAPFVFCQITKGLTPLPESVGLLSFLATLVGIVLLSIGPGLLFLSLIFPLLSVWHATAGKDPYGTRWGWLLAANGLGGLAGAEAANRLLMPVFCMHQGMLVISIMYTLVGVCLHAFLARRSSPSWPLYLGYGFAVLAACGGFVLAAQLPTMSLGPGFEVVESHCGPEGVIAVVDQVGQPDSRTWRRAIVQSNQFRLGSLGGNHSQRRKMLLPLLLHANPQTVGCIGLATGITAGAALDYAPVDFVTAIEISPLVATAAEHHFAEANRHICTVPTAKVLVEDGRTSIAATTNAYDVVVGDLFRPWVSGVGRLYSREHFGAVRRSLRPGGMFCQWLPMYQLDAYQFEVILATFQQVFPNTFLVRGSFQASEPSLGLIGFRDGTIDWSGVAQRCEQVRQQGRILDPTLRHAEGILMQYLGRVRDDPDAFEQINTLDNVLIELDAGRKKIVAKPLIPYLEWASWVVFESELQQRLDYSDDAPPDAQKWGALGRKLCELHLTLAQGSPRAVTLRAEIDASLPPSMLADSAADWSAFPLRVFPASIDDGLIDSQ